MELYVTYHKILDLLQQFQENNPVLKSFGYGNLVEFGDNVSGRTTQYPFFYVVPQSIAYDQNTTTYQLSLLFADRLNEDKDNEKDAVSDMSLVARDFISQVMRGNLMDKMDMIMPVNAIPFMERFNDYVAGVALDAQLVIFEDVNACVEYPTPTPSSTPQVESPTPTPTPTLTPTPTAGLPNPLTLGATWWSQYSNPAFLTLVPNPPTYDYIDEVIDGIDGSTFFQNSGPNQFNPSVYSSCTPSFSGSLINDQGFGQMVTQNGDYTNNTTDFTCFARVNVGPSFFPFGEELITVSDTSYGGPLRWYQIKKPSTGGIEIDVWADPNTDSGFLAINDGLPTDTWINIGIRSYQDGPDYKLEYWTGNTIVQNTSIVYTAVAPAGGPGQKVGPVYNEDGGIAEISWWNRKLTDSEMGQMFTFLNNRYC